MLLEPNPVFRALDEYQIMDKMARTGGEAGWRGNNGRMIVSCIIGNNGRVGGEAAKSSQDECHHGSTDQFAFDGDDLDERIAPNSSKRKGSNNPNVLAHRKSPKHFLN